MTPLLTGLATAIPSPPQAEWHLGPLPLRAYALAILAGIVVAAWMTARRLAVRGGTTADVLEISLWAVPFGIVGGRIYHVISSPQAYFGEGGDPWKAFASWEGGLGIWGAVALGAVGAWIGCRRQGVRFADFADAVAPGLLVAQAIGRLGNWFNQELFGGETTLPWGLEIDDAHLPPGFDPGTLFHPTFLYEMVWNLLAAAVLIWAERRFRLRHGRVFWAYVMIYTLGRLWIELVRIDPASIVLGLRVNVWTSILVFAGALVAFVVVGRRHGDSPDPEDAGVDPDEEEPEPGAREADPEAAGAEPEGATGQGDALDEPPAN